MAWFAATKGLVVGRLVGEVRGLEVERGMVVEVVCFFSIRFHFFFSSSDCFFFVRSRSRLLIFRLFGTLIFTSSVFKTHKYIHARARRVFDAPVNNGSYRNRVGRRMYRREQGVATSSSSDGRVGALSGVFRFGGRGSSEFSSGLFLSTLSPLVSHSVGLRFILFCYVLFRTFARVTLFFSYPVFPIFYLFVSCRQS